MNYVFTNGTRYLARSKNGFYPTDTVFSASMWDNEQKAKNLFSSVPPVLKKQGYHLEAIDLNPRPVAETPKEEPKPLTPEAISWQALPLASCGVPEVEKYVARINDMVATMGDVNKMMRKCREEVAKEDRIQQDLLHKIEFESGRGGVGMRMYSSLRSCRRRRRAYKDLMTVLGGLHDMISDQVNDGYLEKKQEELNSRLYTPRSTEVIL